MSIAHISKQPKPNHRYLVEQALRTSGLPFELRAVIRELAALANWDTGISNYLMPQRDIAAYLGCGERTLGRYLQEIRRLPGKPWVTWTRTCGPGGLGRGIDRFQVHVGDPVSMKEAQQPTLADSTQAAKRADPSGQIDGPKRPTLAEPLDHSDQSNQLERLRGPRKVFDNKTEKAKRAVPFTAELAGNPDYIALGIKLGLDETTTRSELTSLIGYSQSKGDNRADWTFRVEQWLAMAANRPKKPANVNYIASVGHLTPQAREQAKQSTIAANEAQRRADLERFATRIAGLTPDEKAEFDILLAQNDRTIEAAISFARHKVGSSKALGVANAG